MKPLMPYQWTTAILGVLIAGAIFLLVRRDSLRSRYSVWWLLVAIVIVIVGFFPEIFNRIGLYLGVHYPPILIMTLSVGFVLVKILAMDLERSLQERKIRRLTQRLAILEGLLQERSPDEKHQPDDAINNA
jgi:hypothetical protein